MTGNQVVSGRERRSREEIQRLTMEFESSGLRQNEFCRKHGLALSTVQRQLRGAAWTKAKQRRAAGWSRWSWPRMTGWD